MADLHQRASGDELDSAAERGDLQALVAARGVRVERFFAKAGQAMIWSANLLHGGDYHRDLVRTRWSQVTHYVFEGCACHTPPLSDPYAGSFFPGAGGYRNRPGARERGERRRDAASFHAGDDAGRRQDVATAEGAEAAEGAVVGGRLLQESLASRLE